MSALLPEGCTSLLDAPYTLTDNIGIGLVFLGFREMPLEERPDRSIWMEPEALDEHFKQVKRNRERELETTSTGARKQIEDPVDNDAARSLLVG